MDKLRGAGDLVKLITNALGFKQCEKCKNRQIKLNNWIPFSKINFTDGQIYMIEHFRGNTSKDACVYLNNLRKEIDGIFTQGCFCGEIERREFCDEFYSWYENNKN